MVRHLYSKLNILSNCDTNYITLYLKQKNKFKLEIFEILPFIKEIDILWNDSIKLAQLLQHSRIKYTQKLKFYFLAGIKSRRIKRLISKRIKINFIRMNFIK